MSQYVVCKRNDRNPQQWIAIFHNHPTMPNNQPLPLPYFGVRVHWEVISANMRRLFPDCRVLIDLGTAYRTR